MEKDGASATRPTNDQRASTNLVYALFVVPGVLAFGYGLLTSHDATSLLSSASFHIGATLLVVFLIEFTWSKAGGAPLQQDVQEVKKSTIDALQRLETATEALRDLRESGVVRVHKSRERAISELSPSWAKWAASAEHVDILGLTLHRDWFQRDDLKDLTRQAATNGHPRMRVVILASDSACPPPSITHRRNQLGETDDEGLLPGLLSATRQFLNPLVQPKSPSLASTSGLHVRVADRCTLYAMIIRIDDYMFVAPYLASTVGDQAFAFEVRGTQGPVFRLYAAEFNALFDDSPAGYLVPRIAVDKTIAGPGEVLTYTIWVTNTGPGNMDNFVIKADATDILNRGALLAEEQPAGDAGALMASTTAGVLGWTGQPLAVGQALTRSFRVNLSGNGWANGATAVTAIVTVQSGKRVWSDSNHAGCHATTLVMART